MTKVSINTKQANQAGQALRDYQERLFGPIDWKTAKIKNKVLSHVSE